MQGRTGKMSAAVAMFALAVLAACGGRSTTTKVGSAEGEPARTLVGRVDGTDAFVAVLVGTKTVQAYVCDGAGIAGWLHGSVHDGVAAAVADQAPQLLTADVTDTASSGRITLPDGSTHPFTLEAAKGDAGLFRLEKTVRGVDYVGGWIRLNDGLVRGKITTKQTAQSADAQATDEEVVGSSGGGAQTTPTAVPDKASKQTKTSGGLINPFCEDARAAYNSYVDGLNKRGTTPSAGEIDQVLSLQDAIGTDCGPGAMAGTHTCTVCAPKR